MRNIIIEPEGRNTMPCIALSTMIMNRYYGEYNMLVLPSDHLIVDEKEFRNIVMSADKFISHNKEAIITLGMKPTRAETGYGYIKCGSKEDIIDNHKVIKVDSFKEKPDKETAAQYLKEGSYLWNGNNILEQIKYGYLRGLNSMRIKVMHVAQANGGVESYLTI